jgi:NTE family protein
MDESRTPPLLADDRRRASGPATGLSRKTRRAHSRPPFDCIALLLQGGGALGAYQAGVYEALAEAKLHPDWVAGISIGAINSALIAGNSPEARVDRLRQFWEGITADPWWEWADRTTVPVLRGDDARRLLNQLSAARAAAFGAPGFFAPRFPPTWCQPSGSVEATSYYDTRRLKATLERLVDFDRINAGDIRFSVGAVNVRTGNFVYFDTTTHLIRPQHVMASGALPPGFPSVEIDGERYWDGGVVSNTPLQWVLECGPRQDTLAFQVDLWSARGEQPRNMPEVLVRQKEIQYSSRTRAYTDHFKQLHRLRHAIARLLPLLPDELRDHRDLAPLLAAEDHSVYNIVHLIYRAKHYEGHSKDHEFSRLSMREHWRAGYNDAIRTLRHPEVLERPENGGGVFTFDLAVDGRQ